MLLGPQLSRAAPSWADFDDEAEAPVFDVLGDLASAATQRPAAPPIPYIYPSLAPHVKAVPAPTPLPAPEQLNASLQSAVAAGSTAQNLAASASGASLPCLKAIADRSAARTAALFKPFKPPLRVKEEASGRQPAAPSRLSVQHNSGQAQNGEAAGAAPPQQRPWLAAHPAPSRQQLSSVHSRLAGEFPALADRAGDARPLAQEDFAMLTRSPKLASVQPSAPQRPQSTFTLASAAHTPISGRAAVRKRNDAAPAGGADSGHVGAVREAAAGLTSGADAQLTPAEGRSRKKAKRLYAVDVEAPIPQSQVRNAQRMRSVVTVLRRYRA